MRDYINDFFIFLFKTDPVVVNRILNDLYNEGKCGKAPELAKKIVKEMRKGEILRLLSNVNKKDLFSVLLSHSNPALLTLITDLVKELAACKLQSGGTSKKSRSKSKKSRSKSKKSRSKSKKSRSKSKKRSLKKRSLKKSNHKISHTRKSLCFRDKVAKVMGEFKRGKLKTSSGMKVKKRSQALAIALSSGDKYC